MKNTTRRIEALRKIMRRQNIAATVIPSSDPHLSEYPPDRWKTREWISGFTGSAGTMVVTLDKAALWTDSRYFLQAEQELENSGIELMKTGLPDSVDYADWLQENLQPDETVGIEGEVFPASEVLSLRKRLSKRNLTLNTDFSPFPEIWTDRPTIPQNKFEIYPEKYAGKTAQAKMEEVLTEIRKKNAEATIIASLDDIAWLLNIRGADVRYNPVCIAYLFVSENNKTLFIDSEKCSEQGVEYLASIGVSIVPYNRIYDFLKEISEHGLTLLVSLSKINFNIYQSLSQQVVEKTAVQPVELLKSKKNKIEIEGFRQAMIRDGKAMMHLLKYIDDAVANKTPFTEYDIALKIDALRAENPMYRGESFATIAAYGKNGAIVHYQTSPENNAPVAPEGNLLLIDTGGHYEDGTTDITRTLAIGQPTEQMRRDYTLVLKGHLALAGAVFPKGTVGSQLDVLARQFLWQEGLNYGHGTGHGVGHYLSVHEGPHNIRTNRNDVPLEPGMIVSDEPGIYRPGQYGIRIENLLLVCEAKTGDFGEFLRFETITLCPYCVSLIDTNLLSVSEIDTIEKYHKRVEEIISSHF